MTGPTLFDTLPPARPHAHAPRILTGWWSGRLPATHIKIGVSRGVPKYDVGEFRRYAPLYPGPWFNRVSPRDYRDLYFEQLAALDPRAVVQDVLALAGDRVPVLVCYESPKQPDKWCHRGFVSAWLGDALGMIVPEYGIEDMGAGWSHPKVPKQFRRPPLDAIEGQTLAR